MRLLAQRDSIRTGPPPAECAEILHLLRTLARQTKINLHCSEAHLTPPDAGVIRSFGTARDLQQE